MINAFKVKQSILKKIGNPIKVIKEKKLYDNQYFMLEDSHFKMINDYSH